uniref:Uncharacterized protein n=1 Tax=Tetranychus urticae TaxID=32264 RepID=T1K9C5_TETUR
MIIFINNTRNTTNNFNSYLLDTSVHFPLTFQEHAMNNITSCYGANNNKLQFPAMISIKCENKFNNSGMMSNLVDLLLLGSKYLNLLVIVTFKRLAIHSLNILLYNGTAGACKVSSAI